MAIQRAIINQERKTRRIWKDHGCAPSYSSIADFAILQPPWLCNIPHFFLMLKRHFVHQSKATFLWPCCMLPSKSGGQDEIWNKENVTAGNGGGKNLLALKWAEGQVLEWLFKGPHEMTACNGAAFQTLQENVPKLSEGKYCMGNYGTTLAEIPYFLIFFFFSRPTRLNHLERQMHFWILVSSWKTSYGSLQSRFLSKACMEKL